MRLASVLCLLAISISGCKTATETRADQTITVCDDEFIDAGIPALYAYDGGPGGVDAGLDGGGGYDGGPGGYDGGPGGVDAGLDGGGGGDGGGGTCESCQCTTCDDDTAYQNAYSSVFGTGSGSGSASFTGTAPAKEVTEEILTKCNKVAEMTWTETFNCRDFAGWFLRCLKDNGIDGTGLSMWCKNCDDGKSHAHRIVLYPRNGKWCPADPKWGNGEEASSCCNADRATAEKCANDRFCAGKWVNRTTPLSSFAGCETGGRTQRTCEYCTAETCTPEERKAVCKLLNIDDSCSDKRTNTECTQCCMDKHGSSGDAYMHCISDQGAGCAKKP